MKLFRSVILLCMSAAAIGGGAVAAQAQEWAHQATTYQTSGISLDQAIAMMQAKYNARVMRANTVEEDGRVVHYIRLISADRSRVWTVRVDATTGREF